MGILDNLKFLMGKTDAGKPDAAAVPQTPSKKKILIVEDEPQLANALQIKLTMAGFEVILAANGQLGLEAAQNRKPNIILLDLQMPVMDGKTVLHKLSQSPELKDIPVVVLTNAGSVENMDETKSYSNTGAFLIKSNVTPDEILGVVRDLI